MLNENDMTESLHYQLLGSEDKPSMLMVHGMLSSNFQWENNKDFLSKYFRLVMVELWGHGDSPSPIDEQVYSADSYAIQIEQIREELGIDNWIVLGQSFGAAVGITYTLQHPDRVSHLIITNSKLALGLMKNNPTFPSGPIPPLRELPIHPIHSTRLPEDIKSKLVEVADRVDMKAVKRSLTQRHSLLCRDMIYQLSCPILICQGIYEKKFQEPVDFAKTQIPDLTVIEMEAGHNPNRDTPDQFNNAVLKFFQRLQTKS